MTRIRSTFLALIAVLFSPMAANADLIYDLSLEGNIGVIGTVTGTIYELSDNVNGQAATSITIDSAPWADSLWTPGYDVLTVMTNETSNLFTAAAGTITYANLWVDAPGQHFLLGAARCDHNDLWFGSNRMHYV